MAFNEADTDLRMLLSRATNEELDPLLDCLLREDRSGRVTSSSAIKEWYEKYPEEPSRYWQEIGSEIQLYGANTFASWFRGTPATPIGICYHEILVDVAKKLKVNFNANSPSERIEVLLMQKVFEDAWDKMAPEERERFVRETGLKGVDATSAGPVVTMAIQALLKAGGFATYKFMFIIVNAVWKVLFGRGLPFVAGPILAKSMSVFLGPIGWTITGLWLAVDMAGPAFCVTIPAVLQIALIRQSQILRGV